jgi:hypothetical protein
MSDQHIQKGLTKTEWDAAVAVAQELAASECDPNEAAKLLSYLRAKLSVASFQKILNAREAMLAKTAMNVPFVRSGRTARHWTSISKMWKNCSQSLPQDAERLLLLLGWAVRIMRYYNTDVGKAELAERQRAGEHSQLPPQLQASSPPSSQPHLSARPPEHVGQSYPAEERTRVAVTKSRFKVGEQVTARRIEDPKGRNRPWFLADDGFGGVVTRGQVPDIKVGETVSLWIDAVTKDTYNFSSVAPATPRSNKRGKRQR